MSGANLSNVRFVAINVETNTDRREHMRDQARQCNIPLEFFKAITPKTISTVPHNYVPLKAQIWWRRKLIPTEIACGLSHIALWHEFLQSPYEHLVIFEDDSVIDPNFMNVIENSLALPHQYDFIKLSGQKKRYKKHVARVTDQHDLYLNCYGVLDACCYMLSKKGARQLIKYCASLHMGIDILMDRSFSHGVPYHTIEPYPVSTTWGSEGALKSQIGIEERMLRYDHKNVILKIIFQLCRLSTSIQRRLAIISLFFRKLS